MYMAKGHKPRAGSRAFWPKKRAQASDLHLLKV